MKRLLVVLFLLCCLLPMSAGAVSYDPVTVSFLKVGKADCIVIQAPDGVYMIDTATDDKCDDILDFLEDNGIDSIDVLFITHFDKDHIGGAPDLLEEIDIGEVYTTSYITKTSDELDNFLAALDAAGIIPTAVQDYSELTFGDLTFSLYPPERTDYESNDSSLVIRMDYGKTSMLFTGDIESTRINDILADGIDLSTDLLKVPHHGEYNSATEGLAEACSAQYAVITSSKDEKEDNETVDALEAVGTQVYLTRKGTVTAMTDGKIIQIEQD